MSRDVLFLDIDDVLCLNQPFGGYDVLQALSEVSKGTSQIQDFPDLWAGLFSERAVSLVAAIHSEFNPNYVLSTSWRQFMNRPALEAVLKKTGLGFVVENFHSDWQTPELDATPQAWGPPVRATRADEISAWLQTNPGCTHWAVLDDQLSGTGLVGQRWKSRVVLCKENVGFGDAEFRALKAILGGRGNEAAQHLVDIGAVPCVGHVNGGIPR